MQHISAFTNDYDLSNYKDNNNPLTVTCAGYYLNYSSENIQCDRRNGRQDYLIMYCAQGEEYLIDNGIEYRLGEGWMCIYSPEEPQHTHYHLYNSHLYWVHFTGTECENLLRHCNIVNKRLFYIGNNSEITDTIIKLVNETLLKRVDYEKVCSSLMTYCLMLFGRSIKVSDKGFSHEMIGRISEVITFVNCSYQQKMTVDSLAASVNMSKFTFIRNFKYLFGYTPIEYLIHVRIQHAKELLECSGASVKAVSFQIGYDNPFYFSRLFKKIVGISPEAYMNKNRL